VGNKLNTHELKIAANLIVPEEINGSWKNIAGLEHIKKELNQSVIFPMKNRNLLKESGLLKPPKGNQGSSGVWSFS
jgi:ATPases of the AAA+ class